MIDFFKRLFKKRGVDKTLYVCVVFLLIFGIIMIGSASVGQTAAKGTAYATINMIKQGVFVGLGSVAILIFSKTFKEEWINSSSTWVLYWINLFFMVLCLAFGHSKGSYAWIKIPGGFTIQPAEFMKIVLILYLSFHFGEIEEFCIIPKNISRTKKEELQYRKLWYCVGRPILACGLAFLVGAFLQKDFGTSVIIGFICFMMFMVSPRSYYTKYKKLFLFLFGIGLLVLVTVGLFFLKGYQMDRIYSWLNPLSDPTDTTYQLVNSLIAFATGGFFGKGFGGSTQKYGYIPESHNDFIVPIIFEELGFFGFMLLIIPYCILIYKMFNYGFKVKSTKSKMILYGFGIYFFTHLLVNIGGVSGLIPMTGVPLLFVSSGGSSTLAAMIAIGIAQAIISKYNKDSLKEQMDF